MLRCQIIGIAKKISDNLKTEFWISYIYSCSQFRVHLCSSMVSYNKENGDEV